MKKLNPIEVCLQACADWGLIPTEFRQCMTWEEQVLWLSKFINQTIIPALNDTIEATQEVQQLFIELKEYVDSYFDDLNVQEQINNKLDVMAEDGTLAKIINEQIFNELNTRIDGLEDRIDINKADIQSIIQNKAYVTPEELKEESDPDDTFSFERAINDGRPIYLTGEYTVSEPLALKTSTIIIGKDRDASVINFEPADDTSYLFTFTPTVQVDSNIQLMNFKANAKNFIKVNDNDLSDEQFLAQNNVKHIIFSNLNLIGDHSFVEDSNVNTNVVPTLYGLMSYGVGFNLSKCFDCVIEKCNIQYFGLAIYFKGSDICTIRENRINENEVHFWSDRISTYGSQTTIQNNDILRNRRYGAITINGTKWDRVINNYFEQYDASACFVYANNESGLIISKNRVDQPNTGMPAFNVSPTVCADIITENTLNPSSAQATIQVNYDNFNPTNVSFENYNTAIVKNNPCFTLVNKPLILTESYDPNVISPTNIERKTQLITDTWSSPYVYQDTDSDAKYYFLGNKLYTFRNRLGLGASSPKIEVIYRYNNNTSTTLELMTVSSVIKTETVTPTNDTFYHKIVIESSDVTATARVYDTTRLRVTGDSIKIYSIRLVH